MNRTQKSGSWLTWKLEEPSDSASLDDDIGPAWVDAGPPSSYPNGPVSDGRWITRREARAIAEEHGLRFFEDDGSSPERGEQEDLSGLDVPDINRKLRAAGVSESELNLEERPGRDDVLVWGSMLQSLPSLVRDPESPFTTSMVSMSPEEVLDALDQLAPGWRSGE